MRTYRVDFICLVPGALNACLFVKAINRANAISTAQTTMNADQWKVSDVVLVLNNPEA